MNNLILNEQTMSSVEIAELTGKRHGNVRRDIKVLEASYKIVYGNHLKFESVKYKDKKGEERPCYRLTKSQALFVVSGYSPILRAKIQKRWEELEKLANIPQTYSEALLLASQQAKELEEARPKVAIADKAIRNKQWDMSIRDAGKSIGLRQKEIFKLLRDHNLLTIQNLPTQKALNEGVLKLKIDSDKDRNYKQAVLDVECLKNLQKRYLK